MTPSGPIASASRAGTSVGSDTPWGYAVQTLRGPEGRCYRIPPGSPRMGAGSRSRSHERDHPMAAEGLLAGC